MKKILVIAGCWFVVATSSAQTMLFDDETEFTTLLTQDLQFDSFEDLSPSGASPTGLLERDGYQISSTIADDSYGLYVFGQDSGFGSFATDGDVHLAHQTDTGQTLRFDFDFTITLFALSITDWDNLAMTSGAQLVFGNDAGEGQEFVVTATPMLIDEVLFFGLVNFSNTFSYVEIRNVSANEAYGFDGVYFARPIPLPAAFWLFASALLGGLLSLRRSGSRAV
ncbi:MAG: hypothetical protein AB8G18_16985 [Gammaproteobacteria bacterium]